MVWENQLVDLIQMADNEWVANGKLHVRSLTWYPVFITFRPCLNTRIA